jgi:hypothetical protein
VGARSRLLHLDVRSVAVWIDVQLECEPGCCCCQNLDGALMLQQAQRC